MFTLIKKDIQQHTLPLMYSMAVIVAFPVLISFADRGRPSATFFFSSFLMVIFSNIFIANWLISVEKTKRTLFLLRMLPLTGHRLAAAKELVALCMLLFFAVGSLGSASIVFYIRGSGELTANLPSDTQVAWTAIAMVLFMEVNLLSFLWLDQRLAVIVPYGALMLLSVTFGALDNYLPGAVIALEKIGTQWYGVTTGYLMAFLVILLLHFALAHLLERTDWSHPTSE